MKRRNIFSAVFVACFISGVAISANAADCESGKTLADKAYNLGVNTLNIQKQLEQENLYRTSLELCSSLTMAHNNLGDLLEQTDRLVEAERHYKIAADLQKNEATPLFSLGDLYFKTGRFSEAKEYYIQALHLQNDTVARENLATIQKSLGQSKLDTTRVNAETIETALKTRGVGGKASISFSQGLIPFEYNKAGIKPEATLQLQEIGKALSNLTNTKDISVESTVTYRYEISGHTDNRGSDSYNLSLSRQRAQAVIDYLVEYFNIPPTLLEPVGYGERRLLCSQNSEACHAINRRVEINKKAVQQETSRGFAVTAKPDDKTPLVVDVGFMYQNGQGNPVHGIKDGISQLASGRDRYFVYFRPTQKCYVYLLQEDAKGHMDILFPEHGDGGVTANRDYWIPGFGKGFYLDNSSGIEKMYLLVSSQPVIEDISNLSSQKVVRLATKKNLSRAIYVKPVRPPAPQDTPENSGAIQDIIQRIEGVGGWVKLVEFNHI